MRRGVRGLLIVMGCQPWAVVGQPLVEPSRLERPWRPNGGVIAAGQRVAGTPWMEWTLGLWGQTSGVSVRQIQGLTEVETTWLIHSEEWAKSGEVEAVRCRLPGDEVGGGGPWVPWTRWVGNEDFEKPVNLVRKAHVGLTCGRTWAWRGQRGLIGRPWGWTVKASKMPTSWCRMHWTLWGFRGNSEQAVAEFAWVDEHLRLSWWWGRNSAHLAKRTTDGGLVHAPSKGIGLDLSVDLGAFFEGDIPLGMALALGTVSVKYLGTARIFVLLTTPHQWPTQATSKTAWY